ncbi:hypothetical protein FVE85_4173 [Porphyridium purpureum]|uniref:Hexosyltransferase n=1 Tax=Porphyridium purpureum TaxID=35688 RepID=A0A5J4YSD8_PORPP|nr:hypothetical protein FVE85_4173 [Porphyridium purpureum]|eukprot:POR2100..scf229_5
MCRRSTSQRTVWVSVLLLLAAVLVLAVIGGLHMADGTRSKVRAVIDIVADRAARPEHLPARKLMVCIGSSPSHRAIRDAARRGWLSWIPPGEDLVEYRFFTDHPDVIVKNDQRGSRTNDSSMSLESKRELARQLEEEQDTHKDLVFQRIESGYGNYKKNAFGRRALFQLNWSVTHYQFDYLLKMDDDVFLCLHRLLYELNQRPDRAFFWGRFWCKRGGHRADENFMLFSQDVVKLLSDEAAMKLLPFDEDVTLAWNFGLLAWILQLTIFDDQKRLDAQQGYLTSYMHEPSDNVSHLQDYAQFCDHFIFAHHVSAEVSSAVFKHTIAKSAYDVPQITRPRDGCPKQEQSFTPRLYAEHLPDIFITLGTSAPLRNPPSK